MPGMGAAGVGVVGTPHPAMRTILTPDALEFVAMLARKHTATVHELLARRRTVQARFDAGQKPHFLPHTREVREGDWKVAPLPADLQDRRVEITGPTDAKMVINALNSGASVYMADFEDSNCPTWANLLEGQVNMRGAARGSLAFTDPKTGKKYALGDKLATLKVRPRGWHLWETHVLVDGRPVPGGIFDFALFFFHNARVLLDRGSGPYFYLPKMQSHLEARLWNSVFIDAQAALGIPQGSIKATVLIETLPAAFEMDEILYELRRHSAGLNCGRWDYIFSFIKTMRADPAYVMPDRAEVGMTQPCMRAYTQLVIKTCHKRGVHAMGGMAAQIPIKGDPAANNAAMEKVRADKLREVLDGHDGTWIAHPALLPIAKQVFDEHMPGPNQLGKMRQDVQADPDALLAVPQGPRTEAGLRTNISVGLTYLEAWLGGNGCIPIHNMMEDAATAEIARTQVWQWIKHGATLAPGNEKLTAERFNAVLQEELAGLRRQLGAQRFDGGNWRAAAELFGDMATAPQCADFLTLPAYDAICRKDTVTSRM
jgi:malate synthase